MEATMILRDARLPALTRVLTQLQQRRFGPALLATIADDLCSLVDDHYFGFCLFPNHLVGDLVFYTNSPQSFLDTYLPIADEDILIQNVISTGRVTHLNRLMPRNQQRCNNFCVEVQRFRPISDVCYIPLKFRGDIIGYSSVGRAGLQSPEHSDNDYAVFAWMTGFLLTTLDRDLRSPRSTDSSVVLDGYGRVLSCGDYARSLLCDLFGPGFWERPATGRGQNARRFSDWIRGALFTIAPSRALTLSAADREITLTCRRIPDESGARVHVPGAPQVELSIGDRAVPDASGHAIDWGREAVRRELTPRECQVSALVWKGLSNREIGDRLGIAEATVKRHLNTVFEKTGVRSRTQLVLSISR